MEDKKIKKKQVKTPPKFMEKLKVERLCLTSKFFNNELNLFVETWIGETANEYFFVDIACTSDYKICSSIGGINERESRIEENKQILITAYEPFDIFGLAKRLSWDLKKAKIEDMVYS